MRKTVTTIFCFFVIYHLGYSNELKSETKDRGIKISDVPKEELSKFLYSYYRGVQFEKSESVVPINPSIKNKWAVIGWYQGFYDSTQMKVKIDWLKKVSPKIPVEKLRIYEKAIVPSND